MVHPRIHHEPGREEALKDIEAVLAVQVLVHARLEPQKRRVGTPALRVGRVRGVSPIVRQRLALALARDLEVVAGDQFVERDRGEPQPAPLIQIRAVVVVDAGRFGRGRRGVVAVRHRRLEFGRQPSRVPRGLGDAEEVVIDALEHPGGRGEQPLAHFFVGRREIARVRLQVRMEFIRAPLPAEAVADLRHARAKLGEEFMAGRLHLLRRHLHRRVEAGQIEVVVAALRILRETDPRRRARRVRPLEEGGEFLERRVDGIADDLSDAGRCLRHPAGVQRGGAIRREREGTAVGLPRRRAHEIDDRREVPARHDEVALELPPHVVLQIAHVRRNLLDERRETVEVLLILEREEGEDLAVAAEDARIRGEDAPEPEVPVSLDGHLRLPDQGLQRDALIGR